MTGSTRVAIVSGGATGIGLACSEIFIAEGWNVILTYFQDVERAAAEELAADNSGRVVPIRVDVRDDASCRAAAESARAIFGRIDSLVNSAGISRMVPHLELDALSKDDFLSTCEVNTAGAFQMVRACAPLLASGDGGSVIIISSYGAIFGTGSSIAYAASKGGTNTLTMALARVLAPRVRVNAVCPALTTGGFVERDAPEIFRERQAAQEMRAPLRRIGSASEVAASVYWLAAVDKLMTGNCLMLDCGLHLNGDG